jgi:polyisoprenoid-binding protein YceI
MPGPLQPIGATLALLAMVLPARAATVELGPGNAQVGLVAYMFGLIRQPGHFSAFSGELNMDPSHPEQCHVHLHVRTPSLEMAGSIGGVARGPALLDVAHYPDILFEGSCGLQQTSGELTLHGVTRAIVMAESRTGDRFDVTGTLSRRDFGIKGLPGTIGATVGISFSVNLPSPLAAALVP